MKKIKDISKEVNNYADNIIPFKNQLENDIDVIKLDYKKLFIYILKVHRLYDDTFRRSV